MADKVVSLDDIEQNDDIEYATIPGFKEGQIFVIKSLTAGDLIEWTESNDGPAKRTAGLRLIIKSLVDGVPGENGATGKVICTDRHIDLWRKKSHKVTERIVKEILKLNGMEVKPETIKND